MSGLLTLAGVVPAAARIRQIGGLRQSERQPQRGAHVEDPLFPASVKAPVSVIDRSRLRLESAQDFKHGSVHATHCNTEAHA